MRHLFFVLALSLILSGCKGTDSSIELLESELRWMEDQLYVMDRELANTQAKLDSSQRYNEALKKELKQDKSPASRSVPTPSPAIEAETFDESDLVIPEIDLGPDADDTSTSSDPPAIEESVMEGSLEATGNGTEAQAPSILQPDSESTEGFRVPAEPLPTQAPADNAPADLPDPPPLNLEDITRGEVPASDVHVARIVLNSRLSGGYDFDGQPGDDGLLLVIEPQNTAGQYLPLPGDLTITVEDPRRASADARIARWDFNAVETVDYMKKTLLGRGIHLKLPWPNQPPEQAMLKVFATYHATDGRQLGASRNVKIDLGPNRNPNRDPIANASPSSPFETQLLPKSRRAARGEKSVTSLPAPPRAPSPNLKANRRQSEKASRLAQQPWQPSRSKNQTSPSQEKQPRSAVRISPPSWRPYR
ncbi:MAG: hypothetical protein P8N76_12975 [Pirellulaceae bacterium]|nr:hypothetical protein [Pirellulaceae bacterium]